MFYISLLFYLLISFFTEKVYEVAVIFFTFFISLFFLLIFFVQERSIYKRKNNFLFYFSRKKGPPDSWSQDNVGKYLSIGCDARNSFLDLFGPPHNKENYPSQCILDTGILNLQDFQHPSKYSLDKDCKNLHRRLLLSCIYRAEVLV